jgi:SNF2 family DNA or RNA helicase
MVVFEKLLRLRQVAAHPALLDSSTTLRETSGKFEALVELLDDALEEGHKVLVFSQWTSMAGLVRQHLRSLEGDGVRHLYLDGAVPVSKRADLIQEFQREDGPQVMVLSLLAGGEGITLTAADVVILYDRWWNPATEDQAIARAHRIGQTDPVTAYILEAKNTIEERLADLLRRKKELASSIVGEDFAEKRVSREVLLELLEEELSAAQD